MPAFVTLTMSNAGEHRLDGLAKRFYQRHIAFLLHGGIASAPVVQADHFNGSLQVTGMSDADAQQIVRRLSRPATPPR